jgi:hypothetical protein
MRDVCGDYAFDTECDELRRAGTLLPGVSANRLHGCERFTALGRFNLQHRPHAQPWRYEEP